ncbi:MAG: GNAT family N-acetyltransferase [Clostridia bacterium]|nr:GNAT family N-acetyltransferase [Clostridia bacterium]
MECKARILDAHLSLVPYTPLWEKKALAWYQDTELCRQVDNDPTPYTPEKLRRMYTYLSAHGACWYIVLEGEPIGDCALQESGEIAIVLARGYQNRHIGRRVVGEILKAAREAGMQEVFAEIYDFNAQSRAMFERVGFVRGERGYVYVLNA